MHQVPQCFMEMMDIHDHLLQALVLMVGGNDISLATKRQSQARAEGMLTDISAMWQKVKLPTSFRLGLFVITSTTIMVYGFPSTEGKLNTSSTPTLGK